MENVKEGELYKIIKIDNHEFVIKYGYYEEKDRYSKYNDPMPIYPNLKEDLHYTKDGYLIVTHMQEVCEHYKAKGDFNFCLTCTYMKKAEDLIGICTCEHNMKK